MDLSVVIVNYNSWDYLKRCLISLEYLHHEGSDAPVQCEIIVVDNQSPDDRVDEFATLFPQVRFVRNSGNLGFAHGCQLGATQASGKTLLFLNPDCQDPGESVLSLWQYFKSQGSAGIASCRQIRADGGLQKAFGQFPTLITTTGPGRTIARALNPARYPTPATLRKGTHTVDWVSGSVLMIERETLEQLAGWCDGYWMYSEDVDLCRRAHRQGLPVTYCADITIVHHHGGSSGQNVAVRGLTRAETTISRHLYAQRQMTPVAARITHGFLIVFRYLPKLPAKLWQMVSRRENSHALCFDHLTDYYRSCLRARCWYSPRSVQHPARIAQTGGSVRSVD